MCVMIRTKSIYDSEADEDGLRVLVTRYWPRGVKKERAHAWFRDLGPTPALIKAWKAGELTWPEFRGAYMEEFRSGPRQEALERALAMIREHLNARGALKKPVTLLCTCRDGARCHRAILREVLVEAIKKGK